ARWYSHSYNRADFYRLAAKLGWLPRPMRLALARNVGRLAPRLMPTERDVVRATLMQGTGITEPARLDELTTQTFTGFAMCFSDWMSTNRQPVARLGEAIAYIEGEDRMAGLSPPLISLTAHVGNWELAGRLLAGRTERTTHVVVAEEEALHLEQWVRRNGDGVRFITRSRPTISLELVAALRRGEVVAVQGDRALGTRGDALIPFFGRPAPFPLGPFLLARAVGVPLVPAFCVLDRDGRYTVKVVDPIVVRRGSEEDAARTWVSTLENVVRQYPTHWFHFFHVCPTVSI